MILQVSIGGTPCPQTEWVSTSTVVCKLPSVPYAKWFTGDTKDVHIQLGKRNDQFKSSFTYDAAARGPGVVQVRVCAVFSDESTFWRSKEAGWSNECFV